MTHVEHLQQEFMKRMHEINELERRKSAALERKEVLSKRVKKDVKELKEDQKELAHVDERARHYDKEIKKLIRGLEALRKEMK